MAKTDMIVLMNVKGKCTSDQVAPDGPWLKYRSQLDNISNNMLIGAKNFEKNLINNFKNQGI